MQLNALNSTALSALLLLCCNVTCLADGSPVDKLYHPYVEQLEWELEWRMTQQDNKREGDSSKHQQHKIGLGKSIYENVFVEAYFLSEQSAGENFALEAYELEILWQLSEQGEYSLDYGLLFELEKDKDDNNWEFSNKLLLEKEIGRFSNTANMGLSFEWGDNIKNEWQPTLALQTRYRYSPRFEPAIEFYTDRDSTALGPVIAGVERIGSMQALRWEIGYLFGLNDDTSNYTVRALLELEF